jgi:hypothetical protein
MPGKGFNVAVASVAAIAVIAAVVVPIAMGLSDTEAQELAGKRKSLLEANSRKGPLPTPHAVKFLEKYRADLKARQDEVEGFYKARDANLEQLFPEFDRRQAGARYRQLYAEKTQALYSQAAPILVRDSNDHPAPAKEVFAFEAWDWPPSNEEVRLAQMKFNVSQAVVDILLDLGTKAAEAVKAGENHAVPRLMEIRVTNPPEEAAGAIVSPLTGTTKLLLDPRDVPALLSELVGPGKHGLLLKLTSLGVKKSVTLKLEYTENVKPGEKAKTKTQDFLKPVQVQVGFTVLDYVGNGR